MHTVLPEFFLDSEFAGGAASPDDIFSILEALEGVSSEFDPLTTLDETILGQKEAGEQPESTSTKLVSQKSTSSLSAHLEESETELEAANSPQSKRQKRTNTGDEANLDGGQPKISHITVERNRRKQMNENLSVLRSIMPSFYVKRGDQASIVGGVVDYISELQQVLQSLEAKKQRKIYNEVLSPRLVSSPRTLPLSPRKSPLSPRLLPPSLPVSPRTPQTASPYKPHRLHQPGYLSQTMVSGSLEPSSSSSSTSSIDQHSVVNELVANSKSAIADVEVKLCGPNVVLKTISPRMPGQVLKIISALEGLSLEILDVSLNTIDETMLNSFTIKIGIGCKLSAEELAHQIHQTFC